MATTGYSEACTRLEAILAEVAHVLDDIPEGDPIPVDDGQLKQLRWAYGVFPALRKHRYVAHRLGIDLPSLLS